jgi:hypothetical protein
MAVSFEEFARELRAFSDKKTIVNEVRKDLRKPLPQLRKAVRRNAIAKLPSSGGLGQWVAQARFTVRFRDSGRTAGISIKVSRKSTKDRAELDKLDRLGQVRHPLYGHRGHWYSQSVPPGFFTDAWDKAEWVAVADAAVDRALEQIRRG